MKNTFSTKTILSEFSQEADISQRQIKKNGVTISFLFIDCLADKNYISQSIISPIIEASNIENIDEIKNLLSASNIHQIYQVNEGINFILDGMVLIFIENSSSALAISVAGYNTRSIIEPPTSQVTKGPREGFVEDLNTNLSMIRRKIKSPNLSIKNIIIGEETKTKIAVVYLKNLANKDLLKQLITQLKNINIDGVLDSYYIESFLEQGKLSFLKRVGNSEKPDVVASRILEGRISIFVDGSPIVLTVPYLLIEDLQSPEDYYSVPARATSLRLLRILGLTLGFLLPGIYVALQSFHYKVLPLNFLVTLLSSIQGISFPPLIEILFVLFLFDILAEASARMPRILGMALSIVGAIVLGETSVSAGIISPPSIVVVAISSIMLFIVPDQVPQVSLLRTIFTIIGGIAGFYGLLMCFIMLTTYLISADGYGVPILAPYAPSIKQDKQDALIKRPITTAHKPPKSLKTKENLHE